MLEYCTSLISFGFLGLVLDEIAHLTKLKYFGLQMDSPGEKELAVIRLPGISEQEPTPSPDPEGKGGKGVSLIGNTLRNSHSTSPSSLSHSPLPSKIKLTNTPRIDISRASSSSHHDSRDSSPEREIFESADPNA